MRAQIYIIIPLLFKIKIFDMLSRFLLFFILGFFSLQLLYAQYRIEKTLPFTLDTISKDALFNGDNIKHYFTSSDSEIKILKFTESLKSNSAEIKVISLENNSLILKHSFEFPEGITSLSDFILIENKQLYFVAHKQLLLYDIGKGKFENTNDTLPVAFGSFSNLQKINDQFILLYDVYPYHPIDGLGSLQLYIYDYLNDKIVQAKTIPFEGVTFGNAVNKWIRVINEEIFVVSPFSGKVVSFDVKLNEKRNYYLKIEELNSEINNQFQNEKDSVRIINNNIILKEHEEMLAKYGENYFEKHQNKIKFLKNPYYSKEKVSERLSELQNQYFYLDKLFAFDDKQMIVTMLRPGYKFEFKDLYFVNISNGDITDSIIAWRCEIPKAGVIRKKEDYFPLNLNLNRMNEPFFYKKKMYAAFDYSFDLFKEGTKKEIDKSIFKWTNENSKLWSIGIYALD